MTTLFYLVGTGPCVVASGATGGWEDWVWGCGCVCVCVGGGLLHTQADSGYYGIINAFI